MNDDSNTLLQNIGNSLPDYTVYGNMSEGTHCMGADKHIHIMSPSYVEVSR
jgi:hypothetical protein